jgi:hypothetical protein
MKFESISSNGFFYVILLVSFLLIEIKSQSQQELPQLRSLLTEKQQETQLSQPQIQQQPQQLQPQSPTDLPNVLEAEGIEYLPASEASINKTSDFPFFFIQLFVKLLDMIANEVNQTTNATTQTTKTPTATISLSRK